MPIVTLYPFTSQNRFAGGFGPNWNPVGGEPRLLSFSDGSFWTFNTTPPQPDSQSLDGLTWRLSDGTRIVWTGVRITQVTLNIWSNTNPGPYVLNIVASNSAVTDYILVANANPTPPDNVIAVATFGPVTVAASGRATWGDFVRDFLVADNLLISYIASNSAQHDPWLCSCHAMSLNVNYILPSVYPTEY